MLSGTGAKGANVQEPTPANRREIVLELLNHWPDFFDVGSSTGLPASSSGGVGVPSLSPMARHPSVQELGRLLEWLRGTARGHYVAVRDYFDSEWRTTNRPVRRRTVQGRTVVETARVRERVLSRELQRFPVCSCGCGMPRPVCLGVDVVAGAWDRSVPLERPYALLAKLRPLADSDGWTEAA